MTPARTLLALTGVGAAAAGYATVVERRWYTLRHVTVPALRAGARRPLRLLQISDLHLLPGDARKAAFVGDCLRRLRPDLVVATGDLLGHPATVDPLVELLAPAADGRPAVAVLGSNDFYGPVPKNPLRYLVTPGHRVYGQRLDTPRLVAGLRESGWCVLENRRTTVTTVAGPIDVAGLGDPHIDRDRPETLEWSAPGEPVALRLGLVHAPYLRALEVFDRHGFDLVLAGHTHGGQVRVPGVGALVTNCDLPPDKARGLSRHGRPRPDAGRGGPLWLHVSAGLGHSRYAPLRFACRPEASVIDLVPPPGRPPGA